MAKKTATEEAALNPLGFRRICPSCGTKYYDLNKQPPTCPSCQALFDPEGLVRTRRRAAAVDKETETDEEVLEDDLAADEDDIDIEDEDIEDEEGDEDLIEDASELEGDEDDLIVDVEEDEEE